MLFYNIESLHSEFIFEVTPTLLLLRNILYVQNFNMSVKAKFHEGAKKICVTRHSKLNVTITYSYYTYSSINEFILEIYISSS